MDVYVEGYQFDSLEDARDAGFYPDEDQYRTIKDASQYTIDLYDQLVYMGMI